LPIADSFWNRNTPPLGWGCRCEVVQTDEKTNKKEGYKNTTAPKGFDFNPGVEQRLFSDNAGYYTSASDNEAKELYMRARIISDATTERKLKEYTQNIKIKTNGITLEFNKKGIEKTRNINAPENKTFAMYCMYDLKNILKKAKHSVEDFRKSPIQMAQNKGVLRFHVWNVDGFEIKARENTEGKVFLYYLKKLT
jgi:hypothetical protein